MSADARWQSRNGHLKRLARQLLPLLPVDRGEWELTFTEAGWPQFRRDEFGFYLRVGRGDQSARMIASASFGGGIGLQHDQYSERWPQITLSWERSPAQVCAEITRRLIPAAEETFVRLLERHRRKNSREFEKDEAAGQMKAASGGILWHEAAARPHCPGDRDHRFGRRGEGSYEDGAVPYGVSGTIDHGGKRGVIVHLALDVSPDDACAVLRLLRGRHDEDDFRPAAGAGEETDDDDTD